MAPDLTAAHPQAVLNSVVTTVADATHALHQVELGAAALCADQGRPVAAQMLLATVVVRYPDAVTWDQVHEQVADVIASYPARVIAFVRDPVAARAPWPVQVGLVTRPADDGFADVRGQLMVAAIDGRAYDEAASIAAGWSVGDVPLVVWWNGPAPLDDHLFEDLLDLADRIVLDSNGMTNCDADYLALEGLLRREEHARTSDLLWHRLQPWRQAVAQLFDQPTQRRVLDRIEACTVVAGNDRGGRAAALLLVGWLASRLDWELQSRVGADRWSASKGKRTIDIRIDVGTGDHILSEVSMTGAGVTCEVRAAGVDQLVALAHAGGEPAYRRTIRRPDAGLSRLLLEDLIVAGSDAPIFRAAANGAYRLTSAEV